MIRVRADWIQEGSFKDVPATMKVLNDEKDFSVCSAYDRKLSYI